MAEVIEDTEGFIQFENLYSLLFEVKRFTYLRDFSNYFGLIDLFKFERFYKSRYSLNKGLNRFSNIRLKLVQCILINAECYEVGFHLTYEFSYSSI